MKKQICQTIKDDIEGHRSAVAFILFSAWMISFPYEGQVFYALASSKGIDLGVQMQVAIGILIAGLLSGFFVSSIRAAKRVMLLCAVVCLIGSVSFFFAPDFLWVYLLLIISFCEGLWTSTWGWYFYCCTPQGMRMKTASACLGYSALLMIGVNLAATRVAPYLGLSFAILLLLCSFLMTLRLPSVCRESDKVTGRSGQRNNQNPIRILCLFILVININSGLMFSFVNPAFAHLEQIVDWYWAIPYIAVILVGGHLPKTVDRRYMVFSAISMLGLSFLAFMTMGRSISAYLVVDTLLLGACGINDLFWWTTLGEMLDLYKNPAKILGIGLATNVSGVLLGEVIVKGTDLINFEYLPIIIGLTVVFISIMFLPPLEKRLDRQRKDERFSALSTIDGPEQSKERNINRDILSQKHATVQTTEEAKWNKKDFDLTNREYEIVLLLLKGYPRHLIAEELFISETTVKTHIHNVYSKLEVNNRTELIKRINGKLPEEE